MHTLLRRAAHQRLKWIAIEKLFAALGASNPIGFGIAHGAGHRIVVCSAALVVFVKGFHVSPQIGLTIRSTRRRFGVVSHVTRQDGGAG